MAYRDYNRQDWREREARERDRGMWDRASDEMRSWLGDDEAERRRRMDEMRDRNDWDSRYPRESTGWGRQSASFDRDRDRDYYGRSDFGRSEYSRGERSSAPAFERGWGPYYGRGPRGYRRSDERIREDVCDRLTDAPDVDATEVEVQVSNSEVTLRGTVNSRGEKRRAEDIAEQVSGVNDVRNEIRVSGERAGVTEVDLTGHQQTTAIGETPDESRNRGATRTR